MTFFNLRSNFETWLTSSVVADNVHNQSNWNRNVPSVRSIFRASFLILATLVIPFMVWYMYVPPPSHQEGTLKPNVDEVDYDRLLEFQIFEDVCKNSSALLLIFVHSAPDHFLRRKSIRETWGRTTKVVKTVFLLGLVQFENVQNALISESAQHKDLVQGSFLDTYRNLTYKHVMGLKYATHHCPKAKFILKADDDIFVNIRRLLPFLITKFSPPGDLIFCKTKEASPVNRNPNYKWGVTVEEYPGESYPRYCWGFAVVYSSDVVLKLYRAALRTGFFWVDDIHVTGTLAKMAGLKQTDASRHVMNPGEGSLKIRHCSEVDRISLLGFNLAEETIRLLWRCFGDF